jgi:MFS family permease
MGVLMDRIFAPHVGIAVFGIGALGALALTYGGSLGSYFSAISVGFCTGTEVDLIAYLTARYFGLRIFGRLYGVLYSAATLGAAAAPLLYGIIADRTGGYHLALMISVATYLSVAVIMMLLPQFPAVSRPEEPIGS